MDVIKTTGRVWLSLGPCRVSIWFCFWSWNCKAIYRNSLLVRFGLVQPNTTYQGADHASNDNCETNSPSIHLFTLRGKHCHFWFYKPYNIWRGLHPAVILSLTMRLPDSSYLCQGRLLGRFTVITVKGYHTNVYILGRVTMTYTVSKRHKERRSTGREIKTKLLGST